MLFMLNTLTFGFDQEIHQVVIRLFVQHQTLHLLSCQLRFLPWDVLRRSFTLFAPFCPRFTRRGIATRRETPIFIHFSRPTFQSWALKRYSSLTRHYETCWRMSPFLGSTHTASTLLIQHAFWRKDHVSEFGGSPLDFWILDSPLGQGWLLIVPQVDFWVGTFFWLFRARWCHEVLSICGLFCHFLYS